MRHHGRVTPARSLVPVLLVVALLAILTTPVVSDAQERSSQEIERDLDEQRGETSRLQDELDAVLGDVGSAEDELAVIGVRLEDARARLRAAEGRVALAEQALEDAEEEHARAVEEHQAAEEELARVQAELDYEESLLVDQVVNTFKYGTVGATRGAATIEILRRAEDPNEFAVGMKQLKTVVDVQDTTVQAVFELREEQEETAREAERLRGRAAQARTDAAEMLEVVEELRAEAAGVAAEVEDEEAAQARVVASLRLSADETTALLDRAETAQVQLEQDLQAQRQREEERRRREEERRRREEERRRQQEQAATAAGGGSGGAAGGPALSGMVCPVVGARAGRDFSNDWGDPRTGGRRHQGNDIFANRGTPVVAVHDGEVTAMNPVHAPTGLGGVTVTYRTSDGSEWYNAHLDSIADGIAVGASVSRGQTIGTVGNTGNARTTPPHLHLGRRYGGGWVNPWPTISQVC